MKIFTSFLLWIIFCFCLTSTAAAIKLNGEVKSASGKPLQGVQVFTYAPLQKKMNLSAVNIEASSQRYETTTDQNGFFKLPNHGQIVYFRRQGSRPLTKIIALSNVQINVVMEDSATTLWNIPICSSSSDKFQRVGVNFKIPMHENAFIKQTEEFENGGFFYGYDVDGKVEVMVNWSESTSSEPSEEYLLNSKHFSERVWKSGRVTGYESRGVKSDGKLWRRISFSGGAITYQGNSEKSAKIFDDLIDSMCFDEPIL